MQYALFVHLIPQVCAVGDLTSQHWLY